MQKSAVSSQEVSYPAPWVIKTNNESKTDLSVTPSFQKYCEEGKTAGSHLTLDLLKDWKNLTKAEKIIWIPKLSRSLYVPRAWMPGSLQSQEIPDHTDRCWQRHPVTSLPLSLLRPAARVLCCSQLARLWAFCLPALISEATRLIHGTITSVCLVITVRCIKSNLLIKCLCNKVYIDFRETIKSVIAYLKYK